MQEYSTSILRLAYIFLFNESILLAETRTHHSRFLQHLWDYVGQSKPNSEDLQSNIRCLVTLPATNCCYYVSNLTPQRRSERVED